MRERISWGIREINEIVCTVSSCTVYSVPVADGELPFRNCICSGFMHCCTYSHCK